eukprot:126653_1
MSGLFTLLSFQQLSTHSIMKKLIIFLSLLMITTVGNINLNEYETLWKNELYVSDMEHIYNQFTNNNLFNTEFLLFLNDAGFNQICNELCIEASDIIIYKLSVIAWKIDYQQNLIDNVGVAYYQI